MKRDLSYIENIMPLYFPSTNWEIIPGSSGENNTTLFVIVNNEKFVLRIYETHQDVDKVNYEHAVLLALKELPLGFSIPEPMKTMDGQTIVKMPCGRLAGLFRFINGINPPLEELVQIHSFGFTTGQLTEALAKVNVHQRPVYRPYYEIENTHPSCSFDQVKNFLLNPPEDFEELSSKLSIIYKQLMSFQDMIPLLKSLPHQLVHGDLNASNILVGRDGKVSALLDFEFVTLDLRLMEVAVSLSDFFDDEVDETIILAKINSFMTGYRSRVKLLEEEILALPNLIQLRSLDVFIHFLGRYWDEVDSIDTVKKYIHKAAKRVTLIKVHEQKIIELCTR